MSVFGAWCFSPVGGNGSTKTPRLGDRLPPACWVYAYATHRPSGEKLALGDSADTTLPNGSAFLPASVKTQSENAIGPLRTENSSRVPSRDHDSGTCSSSFAGLVRRSAVPPSAGCHQIARTPSRAD